MAAVAVLLFPPSPHYRVPEFTAGLEAVGFKIIRTMPTRPNPDDLLVIWNRHGAQHEYAKRFERVGAKVLVVENGYIGGQDKFHQPFAMALAGHNGTGRWRIGGPERWSAWDIPLPAWRTSGDHILIMPQRGIGPEGTRSPVGWVQRIAVQLKSLTQRPIRVRKHPGARRFDVPLEPDLQNCHCVIIWGSGGGVKALVAGVPVFYQLPGWIGHPAAKKLASQANLDDPYLGDRTAFLRRLAWAQWRLSEIASGYAFDWLLSNDGSFVQGGDSDGFL